MHQSQSNLKPREREREREREGGEKVWACVGVRERLSWFNFDATTDWKKTGGHSLKGIKLNGQRSNNKVFLETSLTFLVAQNEGLVKVVTSLVRLHHENWLITLKSLTTNGNEKV